MSEVVPLRDDPNLMDIPGQLRQLATAIENGERVADGLFVVVPREKKYPTVFGFGIVSGAYDPVIQLELARQWLVHCAAGLLSD